MNKNKKRNKTVGKTYKNQLFILNLLKKMTKNNAKKSNITVSKPNFDRMFDKVLKETPKQAIEFEKHEFKSQNIKNVIDKTQLSILEIPNRLPKAEVKRLEKEFE